MSSASPLSTLRCSLENILFTKELHRRYHDHGINAVAFHPGNIASNFANRATGFFKFVYNTTTP